MSDAPATPRLRMVLVMAASAALAVAAGMLVLSLAPVASDFTLAAVETDVAKRFPMVMQLALPDFDAKLKSAAPPLLIDVRDDAEYSVSHLAGAERVAPDAPVAGVIAKLATQVPGRDVVFYCSVGMRSSVMALETQDALIKAGARSVSNLRGGAFAWHNAGRALVDASGPTDKIHPYNAKWGELVQRKQLIKLDAK